MKFKKFNVSNSNPNGLFTCSRGTRLTKLERKPGNIPLLTAGVGEGQGVAQFIAETPKMTLYKNDITIDMFGLVYYHDYEHYGDDNIHFLVNDSFSHKVKLYITTVIEKALNGYSYGNQFRMADLNDLVISLPIHNILCPDFDKLQDIVGMGGDVDMTTIDTSSWKEFKISDLFDVMTGDFDIQKEHINGKGTIVITAGETDNGVLGKTDIKAKIVPANTITVDMFGKCAYRDFEYKMVTHARVFALVPKYSDFNEKSGLFISTLLSKLTTGFSYSDMCSWNKIKNFTIKLPIKEVEEIDFEYMEKYIAELEGQRIAELEGYLVATGLNDYVLTEEDKQTLSLSTESRFNEDSDNENVDGNGLQVRKFRCGDLFDIHPTKAYKCNNDGLFVKEGKVPVLSNSSVDNGISGFSGLEPTEEGGIITFSDTTTGADSMFYQYCPFIGYAHVQGMYAKDKKNWGEYQQRYFIGVMQQAAGKGWSYSNKFNRKLVAEMQPILPIKVDEYNNPIIDKDCKYHKDGYIPDFDFMEKYIRVVEKLVIADVVKYKDEIINKTKEVISA